MYLRKYVCGNVCGVNVCRVKRFVVGVFFPIVNRWQFYGYLWYKYGWFCCWCLSKVNVSVVRICLIVLGLNVIVCYEWVLLMIVFVSLDCLSGKWYNPFLQFVIRLLANWSFFQACWPSFLKDSSRHFADTSFRIVYEIYRIIITPMCEQANKI